MKTIRTFLFLSIFIVAGGHWAQAQMELPQPSPKAQVMQTVGLTDITIDYSSPGVKGRKIFGDLVPYGKLWRSGANKATSIEFSKDVTINGEKVKAGKYSFFTIPNEKEWTVILNSETELWGTGGYDESKNILAFNVAPEKLSKNVERLRYLVEDFDNEKAHISLEWADTKISFPVQVHTMEQAYESIKKTLEPSWRAYANAARFAFEQAHDLENGMKWIDKSLELQSDWYNNWLKAEMLAETGNYSEALKYAKIAKELGDKNPDRFFYKNQVEAAIEKWQKM